MLRPLPWRAVQALGRYAGWLTWLVAASGRNLALEHLAIAFPEKTAGELRGIARESALHHGTNLFEILHLMNRDADFLLSQIDWEGWDEIERARDSGQPLVLLTAHSGNWEILGAGISSKGLRLNAFARELSDSAANKVIVGLRERFGTRMILRGAKGSTRELLRTLRGNGALIILIDQDTRVDGVWVPFFGRPAYTPVGAAKIALRHKAILLPVFTKRQNNGRHLIHVHPALELPDDPTEATARMTREVERQVRRQPAQWVWMHRRWKRQPRKESSA